MHLYSETQFFFLKSKALNGVFTAHTYILINFISIVFFLLLHSTFDPKCTHTFDDDYCASIALALQKSSQYNLHNSAILIASVRMISLNGTFRCAFYTVAFSAAYTCINNIFVSSLLLYCI